MLVKTNEPHPHYTLNQETKLKNSLLYGVGFLELANACDFAANVWNRIPVPVFAIVLMATGATVALLLSVYAYRDAKLSLKNIRLLRMERHRLHVLYSSHRHDAQVLHYLGARLDVNFREFGTEVVDRIGMDFFMGIGAVLVAVGTYMAIGGANPQVFLVSNLLSGYVGNSLPAAYGVCNAVWSVYVTRRAHLHHVVCVREIGRSDEHSHVLSALKRRVRAVQRHAILNGMTGILGSAASLVTATQWWGYVILVVCIISSVYCNYIWRHGIGYDRPLQVEMDSVTERVTKKSLVKELSFALVAQKTLLRPPPEGSLPKLLTQYPVDLPSVMSFLQMNYLFEDFCLLVVADKDLSESIFGTPLPTEITISPHMFLSPGDIHSHCLLEIARSCVDEVGSSRFRDRERYLVETLGCYLSIPRVEPGEKNVEGGEKDIERGEGGA